MMRLLIADDNRRMRCLLQALLRDPLKVCWEAENGLEAVRLYAKHHPDAVLMDICMPVMDGIEATRRIIAGDPDATILIVTEFDNPAYRAEAAQAGAREYVYKDNLLDLPATLEDRWHLVSS